MASVGNDTVKIPLQLPIFCECHEPMQPIYWAIEKGGNRIYCDNPRCELFDVQFEWPTIELTRFLGGSDG